MGTLPPTPGPRTRPAPPHPAPGTCRPGSGVGATLAVAGGLHAGGRFALSSGHHIIGRSSDAAVRLANTTVSRGHARLTIGTDGSVHVVDLGSTNGTHVDGRPVTAPTALHSHSLVQIGSVLLRTLPRTPASQAAPPGNDALPASFFNRPPPNVLARPLPPLEPPTTTRSERGPAFAWAGLLAPLAVGLVLAVVFSPMMAVFALMGPVFFLATWAEQRRRAHRTTRRRGRRFRGELANFEGIAARRHQETTERARAEQPDPPTLLEWAEAGAARFWSTRPGHADFLRLAVGAADAPWDPELASPGGESPAPEAKLALALLGPLPSVPVVAAIDEGPIGLVGPRGPVLALARQLLVQLAVRTGPADLRIGLAADDDLADDWEWAGALPHTRPLPHHGDHWSVVVFDGEAANDTRSELRNALDGEAKRTGIVLVERAEELPASCRSVVELLDDDGSASVRWPAEGREVAGVLATGIDLRTATDGAARISRFRDPDDIEERVPETGDLLDLLGLRAPNTEAPGIDATDRDELAVACRAAWDSNDTPETLRAAVGCGANGPFVLDLVADGPHALIGGTTGSGKSGLLRALVLALAATYSPDRVTFVLVDFKGGSAFDDCVDLPHTVGLVTDLDDHLGERALASLDAELRRRERLLRRSGAPDITDYPPSAGVGSVSGPLPRLVVVVDEFAALANELPGFVDSLVSLAQRGRSLGLHLVLATQRPSGAITENIRTNTNVRIALRMLDTHDSTDVIGSDAAAQLPRHQPGRAIARLGPGELTELQVARTVGSDALIAAIAIAHKARGGPDPLRPWLPPLPERVLLADLSTGDTVPGGHAMVPIGLADHPATQSQEPWCWDPTQGNLLVYGMPGSGTSTALCTVAASLARIHPPEDLHLYAIDIAGDLSSLTRLEHLGALIDGSERGRHRRLCRQLTESIEARRSEAAAARPTTVVLIDDLGGFTARHDDLEGIRILEELHRIYREGPSVGVHVVAAADRLAAVPAALAAVTRQKLILRLPDAVDYAGFGLRPVTRRPLPGRGVTEDGVEIQVAVADSDDRVTTRNGTEPVSDPGSRSGPRRRGWAVPVGDLPGHLAVGDLDSHASCGTDPWWLPVGLGDHTLEPAGLVLHAGEHALIAGPPRSGRTTALRAIATLVWPWDTAPQEQASMAPEDRPVVIVLSPRPSCLAECDAVTKVVDRPQALIAEMARHLDRPILLLVDDAEFVEDPADVLVALLTAGSTRLRVVAAGHTDRLRGAYSHWTRVIRQSHNGLILHPDPSVDGDLLGVSLPRRSEAGGRAGRGWLVCNGCLELVQVASP